MFFILKEKRDFKNLTGRGGGKQVQFTPLDNAVLDVIGRESAAAVGIEVKEPLLPLMSTGSTVGATFFNLESTPMPAGASFGYSEGDSFFTPHSSELSPSSAHIENEG